MKAAPTSLPVAATPPPAGSPSGGSVVRRGSIVLMLGFAATAVVLLSNPDTRANAVPEARAAEAISAASATSTFISAYEDPSVTAAASHWAWEVSPRAASRPGGPSEVMELWYPSSN